jgi:hypothetical protein
VPQIVVSIGLLNNWKGKIMNLKELGWESTHWIHRIQDGDKWRAFVNTVMSIWVS